MLEILWANITPIQTFVSSNHLTMLYGLKRFGCRLYHHSKSTRYIDATAKVVSQEPAAISSTGAIPLNSPAAPLLSQDVLIVERQLEMMNVFLGYEQANRYVILNQQGQHLGYIAEQGASSILSSLSRQFFHTHRAFKADVMDSNGQLVLQLNRPFSWINSRLQIHSIDYSKSSSTLVGEVLQKWHLWRRRYELFLAKRSMFEQFAKIDERVLSWEFLLRNEQDRILGSVSRNFMGLPREFFTDTGNYVLRFTSTSAANGSVNENQLLQAAHGNANDVCARDMSLEERAVMLGSAVTIDFDYFSRIHGGPALGLNIPFMFGGSSSNHDYPAEDLSAQEILKNDQETTPSTNDSSSETKSPFLSDADLDQQDFWDIFDRDGDD
ncbi:Phospholipid scramblase [Schizosaccharomyces pombe]